jgi:hypothetical protein
MFLTNDDTPFYEPYLSDQTICWAHYISKQIDQEDNSSAGQYLNAHKAHVLVFYMILTVEQFNEPQKILLNLC